MDRRAPGAHRALGLARFIEHEPSDRAHGPVGGLERHTLVFMAPRYDLLAIDLDGTLLGPDGRVSETNRRAVARARDAGLRVTLCTGRGLVEAAGAMEAVNQTQPVVVAGGSIIACPTDRRTLHRFPIDEALTIRATRMLLETGHAVLVLKDALEVGYDYLVVRGEADHPIDPVTAWWFEAMNVRVRYATHLHEDEHPEHTVRVGVCGLASRLSEIKSDVARHFGDALVVQHFPAVVAPEHTRTAGRDRYDIFEIFDRKANKWTALTHLASSWGIAPSRIAAVGDEINDVEMIAHAGLGIAMGNAVPAVRAVAARHTRANAEDGVAHAIDRILEGAW